VIVKNSKGGAMSEQDKKHDDKKQNEELTAEDLEQVAGGASDITARKAGEKPLEFLKIKLTD
jgi:hypothetical protein